MKSLLVLVAILALTSANISFLADRNFFFLSHLFILSLVIEPEPCPICCQTLSERPSMNYTFYINTGHFVGGSGKYAIDTYGYSGNGNIKYLAKSNFFKVMDISTPMLPAKRASDLSLSTFTTSLFARTLCIVRVLRESLK